jgi:hypothetical protein
MSGKTKKENLILSKRKGSCELSVSGTALQFLESGSHTVIVRKNEGGLVAELVKNVVVETTAVRQLAQPPMSSAESACLPLPSKSTDVLTDVAGATKGTSLEEPMVPKGDNSSTSSQKKKSKSPTASKSCEVTPLVRVKTRMTRMGLWDEGKSLEDNLTTVNPETAEALNFQSKLWKEYAMKWSLPGYQEAASNRESGLRRDPDQLSRKEALAHRKVGKCLRQTCSEPPQGAEQEKGTETQVPVIEADSVQDQSVQKEEGERSFQESSRPNWATVTKQRLSSSQEEGTTTTTPFQSEGKPFWDPAKGPRMFPPQIGGRGGRGRATGRKARGGR